MPPASLRLYEKLLRVSGWMPRLSIPPHMTNLPDWLTGLCSRRLSIVRSLVVRMRLEQILPRGAGQAGYDAEDLWIHSLAVSYAADCLADRVSGVDRGLVATLGLLHPLAAGLRPGNGRGEPTGEPVPALSPLPSILLTSVPFTTVPLTSFSFSDHSRRSAV